MRYSCGSLSAAYISATSSASSAMCSSVARSAASEATDASIIRRASNICQGRNPCRAPSTFSELESSAGGPLETKVPAPWRLLSTPMAERKPMPARREERLIFSSRASSRSGGRRSPGRSAPLAIRARTWSTTCRVSWLWPPGSSLDCFFVRRGIPSDRPSRLL